MSDLRADAFSQNGSIASSPTGDTRNRRSRRDSEPPGLELLRQWDVGGDDQTPLQVGSAPNGTHPLAVFSTVADPCTLSKSDLSPREAIVCEALPKSHSSPNSVGKRASKLIQSFKKLAFKTSSDVQQPLHTTRERSSTIDVGVLSTRSAPASPRVLTESASFDNPRLPSVVEGRESDEVARLFAALHHNDDDSSNSSASTVDDHSRFAKAVGGGSPGFGASVIFDLDVSSDERRSTSTIKRAVSTSSVSELRKRLVAEGSVNSAPVSPKVSSSSSSSTSSANSSSESTSTTPPPQRRMIDGRVYQLKQKKLRGFTLIDYNPDPLAQAPWLTYLIPNEEISSMMRTYLERAHRSDHLKDPYRLCGCMPGCRQHASPDSVAKLGAIFALDSRFTISNWELRLAAQDLRQQKTGLRQGAWEIYLVPDVHSTDESAQLDLLTNFQSTPITYRYRFKVFL